MTEWHFERLPEPSLHGLSNGPVDSRAIHIHGSWGNFYENVIALDTAAAYLPHGIGYASVNTLGHDAETMYEDFTQTSSDIVAWLDHLGGRGTTEWILQGHSLGALKVIRGLIRGDFGNRVRAAVLLSPFDLPAFYAGSGMSSEIDIKKDQVERSIDKIGPTASVPTDVFSTWPVSLGTIRSALTRGGDLDVFTSREGNLRSLADLGVPVLVLLGGADFAATPDNHDVADLCQQAGVEVSLIEGAPHNFSGYEKEVQEAITQFLSGLT